MQSHALQVQRVFLRVGRIGRAVFQGGGYSMWEVLAHLPADRKLLLGFCLQGPGADPNRIYSRQDALGELKLYAALKRQLLAGPPSVASAPQGT